MPPDLGVDEKCFLTWIPRELLDAIVSRLPNSAIKSLRATNKLFNRRVPLRIGRVFLSANSLNIQVFRAIADHEQFRQGVTEIVWDDARLLDSDAYIDGWRARRGQGLIPSRQVPRDCPEWFQAGRKDSLEVLFNVFDGGERNTIPDNVMSLEDCWQYYKTMLLDQNKVLDSGLDIEALKYGLVRFPSLKRITLTPSAHGSGIGHPAYETPMLRAFPSTFAYPIPRGWPGHDEETASPETWPWNDGSLGHREVHASDCTLEEYKNIWRGFRVVLRTLAETEHNVSEFVMAMHHRNTGMNCHIFDQPCQEYQDFAALLSRPGFRRLDLALCTSYLELEEWYSFRSGLLRNALAAATDLEHFSISSNMDIDADGVASAALDNDVALDEAALPLPIVFPVEKWPHLKHFGITRFLVFQSDLIRLLQSLPESLSSVELSYLSFVEEDKSYMTLLCEMRQKPHWQERPAIQRPKVQIKLYRQHMHIPGYYVCVDKAADRFIYSNSTELGCNPNPFGEGDGLGYNPVEGLGAVDRDYLNPNFERPHDLNGNELLSEYLLSLSALSSTLMHRISGTDERSKGPHSGPYVAGG
ncbi:hypothetical protein NQ176_g5059 [Zarea fungicola]|uniref:Uncharacterized protein n=1 Tax=Zarea fungicola TaxID=93591 RepID=A0ACC1NBJ7_9HYPO|nr:hypothetical protein NQ176_g5059 [Lecanicillium fungicola]